ncbi:MAG: hypothetical protein KF866_07775 [Phycisphaeraceae bacterium]|nr:hypothetical protein [Phycisphaeraceae bacterium]MCW5753777.1 hypothetical protein [Phycisphaeraceae bacterium]
MPRWNIARYAFASIAAASVLLAGCQASRSSASMSDEVLNLPPAVLAGFDGYARTVTTSSPEAQRWFDIGIQLLYGFNHDEAIRAFRRAAEMDPTCAMAWWGVGYAHGLHINNPQMGESQSRMAYEASQTALGLIDHAAPVEQALISALIARYEWPPPSDRRPLDEAYARHMEMAFQRYPQDPDVGALYAESLMNLQPWDLWTHEGEPKGRTLEIVETLEHVLRIAPMHPGANHFYIHAVEASKTPERATAAAERLTDLVPGSGHLVHMPSHIFIRTGRYAEAADANERAIAADEAYFAVAPPARFYSLYFMHNIHFLAYAAMMEGRYETALAAARKIEKQIPAAFLREYVTIADGFMPTALHVLIRFGKWEEILREPEPPSWRLFSRAERHYARTVALAALRRTAEARRELARFDAVAAQVDDSWYMGNNPGPFVLRIARLVAAGELAYAEGRPDEAFGMLREAVELEDMLAYDEPPGWMQPTRHALGALLEAEGRFAEAEKVFREDLERHPNNGWALLGLRKCLLAQGEDGYAAALDDALARAWARADVKPTASCYCHPEAR